MDQIARLSEAVTQPYYSPNVPNISALLSTRPVSNTFTESTEVFDHMIEIDAKQILHPDGDHFRGFYMVPLKVEKFKFECEIMCSEFTEPIKQGLVLNVTESK